MNAIESLIPGVFILTPKKFEDQRGFFYEAFNQKVFSNITKTNYTFVQDNFSFSLKNTLRGLHYQREPFDQGKLVRVLKGKIFDVAVDIRKDSLTFGKYVSIELSSDNLKQLWIPPGFAHGFYVLSDSAEVSYKATQYYAPEYEESLLWNDKTLNINWPINKNPLKISKKDLQGKTLNNFLKA